MPSTSSTSRRQKKSRNKPKDSSPVVNEKTNATGSNTNVFSSHSTARGKLQYAVELTKQAYEDREESCSYKDYLALITIACYDEHEIKHIQRDKFKTNAQIELELLKRWNKLPLDERNKYENEAIDNDIFHQIAYVRLNNDGLNEDQPPFEKRLSIRKELVAQWDTLPDAEKIVHKRVVTNRDIGIKRIL